MDNKSCTFSCACTTSFFTTLCALASPSALCFLSSIFGVWGPFWCFWRIFCVIPLGCPSNDIHKLECFGENTSLGHVCQFFEMWLMFIGTWTPSPSYSHFRLWSYIQYQREWRNNITKAWILMVSLASLLTAKQCIEIIHNLWQISGIRLDDLAITILHCYEALHATSCIKEACHSLPQRKKIIWCAR